MNSKKNIKQAAKIVATWPKWKIENTKLAFSEDPPKIPKERRHMKPSAKITVPEVIKRFTAYKQRPGNGCWGSLHIVLDDGNIKDSNIQFCIDYAIKTCDTEGVELGKILLSMSKSQRLKLYREA